MGIVERKKMENLKELLELMEAVEDKESITFPKEIYILAKEIAKMKDHMPISYHLSNYV